MARRGDTRDVDRDFGLRRLKAARAFMQQAEQTAARATDEYQRATAISSAIQAAIAAADAVCAVKLGQVWKGEHALAHTLVGRVVGAGPAAQALRRLVADKTKVQYLAGSVSETSVTTALRQGRTVLELAERVHTGG